MPRALASLTLSFGLVSIPVRVYNATEPAPRVRFRLLAPDGSRIRQQYLAEGGSSFDDGAAEAAELEDVDDSAKAAHPRRTSESAGPAEHAAEVAAPDADTRRAPSSPPAMAPSAAPAARAALAPASRTVLAPDVEPRTTAPAPAATIARVSPPVAADDAREAAIGRPGSEAVRAVARDRLLKGVEVEKGRYVAFTPDELAELATPKRDTIDIIAFVPEHAVDPVYYDKAYYLVPERRGGKPYALLREALQRSRRSAIATWAWRGRESVAEVRATEGGLVLQQLHYASGVRSIDELRVELEPVGRAELELALRLVEANAEARYDATRFVDEAQVRLRDAIERKVAGRRVIEPPPAPTVGAQVIDLMEALRASLRRGLSAHDDPWGPRVGGADAAATDAPTAPPRKPARRAAAAPASSTPAKAPRNRGTRS